MPDTNDLTIVLFLEYPKQGYPLPKRGEFFLNSAHPVNEVWTGKDIYIWKNRDLHSVKEVNEAIAATNFSKIKGERLRIALSLTPKEPVAKPPEPEQVEADAGGDGEAEEDDAEADGGGDLVAPAKHRKTLHGKRKLLVKAKKALAKRKRLEETPAEKQST
ncbi:MAG: hypothetical protein LBT00_13280 [Spirochaetaceae bacterium]|jgi:hypothetical protein|nr:hypothetical protein [Spirochaetaceae bacterium]